MSEDNKVMSDGELSSVCMQEISRGIGGLDSTDDADISLPLDYFLGRYPGVSARVAKDPSASKYVSMDVMDTVMATVAEIMPSFTQDDIAFYEADGETDELQARQESEIVNNLFFEQYDGTLLLQQAIIDACLHRNCTAKVYWDERAEVTYEEFEGVPSLALDQLLQPNKPNQSVEITEQIVTDTQYEQTGDIAIGDEGFQPEIEEIEIFNIKIKRTTIVGKPVVMSIPPEQAIICGDHTSPSLHDVRFAAHEMIETKSSLLAQGFDPEVVDKLGEYTTNVDNYSRQRHIDENDYSSAHDSTKLIRVFECYINIDYDGDGIAERRKVVISGGHILSNDEWNTVPLCGGVISIMPHKYKGISLYERIKSIQDAKTPIIRSIIDGTQLAASPRLGIVTGNVNVDDILTSRTGGIVRATDSQSIFQLPNAEVPQSAYSLVTMMDSQRRERGGSAVGMANQASSAMGQGGDFSLDRVMTSMELSNALIARTIGETIIRSIFIQLHNLLRENHQGQVQAQVGGRWLTSMPSEWKHRSTVSIKIGASHAERSRQGAVMQKVIELQGMLQQAGSTMVTPQKAYQAITNAISLNGVKNPELYFVDPSSKEGQAAAQQSQQAKQAQAQKEEAMQQQMIKAQQDMAQAEVIKGQAALQAQQVKFRNDQLRAQIEEIKIQLDAAKATDKTTFDYDKLLADTSIALTGLEVQAGRDLSQQNRDNQL